MSDEAQRAALIGWIRGMEPAEESMSLTPSEDLALEHAREALRWLDKCLAANSRVGELREAFKHTHQSSEHGDICGKCGLDLRDEIHLRVGE